MPLQLPEARLQRRQQNSVNVRQRVSIRLEPSTIEALNNLPERELMTFTGLVEAILVAHLKTIEGVSNV